MICSNKKVGELKITVDEETAEDLIKAIEEAGFLVVWTKIGILEADEFIIAIEE